jgi:hypothetical protein
MPDQEKIISTLRYTLYARSRSNTNEAQRLEDWRMFGEIYSGFYIWLNTKWIRYGLEKGETMSEAIKRHGDKEDPDFDRWLETKILGGISRG